MAAGSQFRHQASSPVRTRRDHLIQRHRLPLGYPAMLLPTMSGAIDGGEEQGDGAGRQVDHSGCAPGVLSCARALYCGASSQQHAAE